MREVPPHLFKPSLQPGLKDSQRCFSSAWTTSFVKIFWSFVIAWAVTRVHRPVRELGELRVYRWVFGLRQVCRETRMFRDMVEQKQQSKLISALNWPPGL